MNLRDYIKRFIENDVEDVKQHVPNAQCEEFLLEHSPRLYCPDEVIEETFAFRCFSARKHIMKTDAGYLLSEFLVDQKLPWAGKYNTINAPLTHHLNEFRWLGYADMLIDYIDFFIKGDGSVYGEATAFKYHTPALAAMYGFCKVCGMEKYLAENAEHFEKYFLEFERRHITECGLYKSIDDREGTEYSVSGTTPELKLIEGLRPLMNSCMYADAAALGEIFRLAGEPKRAEFYADKAKSIRNLINTKLWEGEFYRALHPDDGRFDKDVSFTRVAKTQNVRELVGYIPWCFGIPEAGRESAFELMKDEKAFLGKTGLTTADISHPRFMYYAERGCSWNGKVWPYATSYAINAVISLLDGYEQSVMDNSDLYSLIKHYANMHYSWENGKYVSFIDEVMLPFEHIWDMREKSRRGEIHPTGGPNRGKDYNHSTFVDLVIRGLCGIDPYAKGLTVKPRIGGVWSWFKLENLCFRGERYDVYYDEDGSRFGNGKGIRIEKHT